MVIRGFLSSVSLSLSFSLSRDGLFLARSLVLAVHDSNAVKYTETRTSTQWTSEDHRIRGEGGHTRMTDCNRDYALAHCSSTATSSTSSSSSKRQTAVLQVKIAIMTTTTTTTTRMGTPNDNDAGSIDDNEVQCPQCKCSAVHTATLTHTSFLTI
uniref:Putative secreted protein n=1 Tax=Anopheles marajoara TaxID=58244 RepID=A0A2M4C6A6_9DIPT